MPVLLPLLFAPSSLATAWVQFPVGGELHQGQALGRYICAATSLFLLHPTLAWAAWLSHVPPVVGSFAPLYQDRDKQQQCGHSLQMPGLGSSSFSLLSPNVGTDKSKTLWFWLWLCRPDSVAHRPDPSPRLYVANPRDTTCSKYKCINACLFLSFSPHWLKYKSSNQRQSRASVCPWNRVTQNASTPIQGPVIRRLDVLLIQIQM